MGPSLGGLKGKRRPEVLLSPLHCPWPPAAIRERPPSEPGVPPLNQPMVSFADLVGKGHPAFAGGHLGKSSRTGTARAES